VRPRSTQLPTRTPIASWMTVSTYCWNFVIFPFSTVQTWQTCASIALRSPCTCRCSGPRRRPRRQRRGTSADARRTRPTPPELDEEVVEHGLGADPRLAARLVGIALRLVPTDLGIHRSQDRGDVSAAERIVQGRRDVQGPRVRRPSCATASGAERVLHHQGQRVVVRVAELGQP
jgi:hypothetical protein